MRNYKCNCLTFYILFSLILFSCESTEPELDVEEDPFYKVDDIFQLNIYEGHFSFLNEDPEPQNIVHLVTDSIYPCYNYKIIINQEINYNAINLKIDSIYISSGCLTALGPAQYYGEITLENGDVSLNIMNGNTLNEFKLSVSDSLIRITPINDSYVQLSEQLVWRYRENSFVYSCGTMNETTWMYDDFRDSILAIESISQFFYSDSGRIPYPRQPSGHYVDHPCLFFQYANKSDWELVKQKLIEYSKNTIAQYSGIGVYVENFLNDREWSWRHD